MVAVMTGMAMMAFLIDYYFRSDDTCHLPSDGPSSLLNGGPGWNGEVTFTLLLKTFITDGKYGWLGAFLLLRRRDITSFSFPM